MAKRWLLLTSIYILLSIQMITQLSGATEIGITPTKLEYNIPAGGFDQQKLFVQNIGGTTINAEFSVSRQLVKYIHIVEESPSVYSVYSITDERTAEQTLEGEIVLQLTARKDTITTAEVLTIEKHIPVTVVIKGRAQQSTGQAPMLAEEPIIPLSFNSLPLVLLAFVGILIANIILRKNL